MSSKSSRIISRKGAWLLTGALAAALSGHAQAAVALTGAVIDDFEAGSNQNLFLGYSYFYADGADQGTSKVLSSVPGATATELLFDPVKSIDAGYNSTKSLKVDFQYGANRPVACGGTCAYGQMVGFGTQLIAGTDPIGTAEGKTLDLTGATAITFWAKASVAMKVRVEITTTSVTDFAFHRGEVTVTTAWAQHTVLLTAGLGGINQPTWTTTPVVFDPKKVQKLQFQISADDNATLTAGTLWLDDIMAVDYTWVPPSACIDCVGPQSVVNGALFSNLEPDATSTPARPANQNATGGFWFVYNDVGTRTVTTQSQYSEIFGGVDLTDPKAPLFQISPDKGAAAGPGAYIKFTLGPTYTETGATSPIKPFVGIGSKTSDLTETTVWSATGSTGIAFDYWTEATSTFKYIRLEVKTNQTDLGPNPGVVHQVLIPATGGVWKTANIPWTKLVLPDWDEVPNKLAPLKSTGIVKFQWAIQDAPGTTGALAIDNVKIPGMTSITPIANSVRPGSRKDSRGLTMHQAGGRLNVAFDLPAGVRDAKVSLLDLKGAVVASRDLTGKGSLQGALDIRNLRSGVYSLKVSHGGEVRSATVTLLQ